MEKKINTTDVGERINDTKKEIAQLSEELEKLIKSNAGLSNINFERGQSHIDNTIKSSQIRSEAVNKKESHENVDLTKKANVVSKPIMLPEAKAKTQPELLPNKKIMIHSKESTREFMRQQREKREEQRKKTNSKNKIDLELKKQKLLELQQKSMALVQRNIQLKRERSKSREGRQQIRIDKSNLPSSSAVSIARKSSNDHLSSKKSASDMVSKKPLKSQERSIMNSRTQNVQKNKHDQPGKSTSQKPNMLKDKSSSSENKKFNSEVSINKDQSKPEIDLAARKIQAFYRGYQVRKQVEKRKQPLKQCKDEIPIKESKETQTSTQKQIDFPTWLQPPSIDPYPCNFINTIKKKLQLVVNSPVRSKDVGIQSSIMEPKPTIQVSNEKILSLVKENSKSDIKRESHSQRAANLDADALQHFALINFREKYSKKNQAELRSDSESDTSKNIPEISTESGLVSDEKLTLVSERSESVLPINTDKIKNLTLRKPMDENFSNRRNNISRKSYTFNFSEENPTEKQDFSSEKIVTEESHSRKHSKSPRDSILSFNISNESETPSIVSQKNRQLPESTSNEEIRTEKSNISHSSEKENSRRKLVFTQKESTGSKKSNRNDKSTSVIYSKNSNSHKYDAASASDHSWNSIKTSPVPVISERNRNSSHSSSRSSKQVKNSNSSKILDEALRKPENKLISPTFEGVGKTSKKIPTTDSNSESSEVIITSSITSSTSTKFSNRSNLVPSESKNKSNDPEVGIQSLLNSLKSNKSRSTQEVTTDLSDKDVSQRTSKMTETVFNGHHEESSTIENYRNNEIVMTVESKEKLNLGEMPRSEKNSNEDEFNSKVVKNFKSRVVQSKSDANEIHLKFEAEVHLLNDFNESLKQFMAVEKAFESLKNKNETSFRNSSKNSSAIVISGDSRISTNLSKHIGSTINTSRGSDMDDSYLVEDSLLKSHLRSSTNLELSSMQKSTIEHNSFTFNENIPNNLAGLSIKMFEQFIKDEDIRIENLKTIIKIREQALLDRTKGELAWLEIQRKHLKETGKLHEASLVKKKQRGILLKHQQERREMQRLKQLQKIQSNERKTILKEQKNLIKAKLTSEKLMTELKIQTPRKQRPSGPLKVLKASESHSETSLSRRASDAEEIFSITSRSRSIKLSEVDSSKELVFKQDQMDIKTIGDSEDIDNMKKALLVRQASLMKRRKAVEDLLKRHQKLLEEEKKIKELEMAANAIIMQLPSKSVTTREPKIKSHLKEMNQIPLPFADTKPLDETCHSDPQHKSTIGANGRQAKDESLIKIKANVSQSEYSFNTFYENAKATINKMQIKQNEKEEVGSSSSNFQNEYSEDFESEKHNFETESNENNISSISELIEDFTQIEQGISMFSKQFNETTLDTSATSEEISELSKIPSQRDIKKTINIPSVPKVQSVENISSAALINTEEIQTVSDVIKSLEDEKISSPLELQASSAPTDTSSKPEERLSEQIPTLEIRGETTTIETNSSELSELEAQFDQNKGEGEEVATEEIASGRELLKVISTSEELPESDIKVLMQNITDSTEQNSTSEIVSVPNDLKDLDDHEDIKSQIISLKEKESAEIEELSSNEENNDSADELSISHVTEKVISNLIFSEPKNDEETSLNSLLLNKNENSPEIIENEGHEIIEEIPEITSIKSKSQEINEESISKEIIPSENKEFEKQNDTKSGFDSDAEISSQHIVSTIPSHKSDSNEIINSIAKELSDSFDENENQDVHSLDKEETYKDIPSIETNSELYISEIKTDDTTNKDISDINDILEVNLVKDVIELEHDLSDKKDSRETVDEENFEYSSEEIKSKPSLEGIVENDIGEDKFESSKLLMEESESQSDKISHKTEIPVSEVSKTVSSSVIDDIAPTEIPSNDAINIPQLEEEESNVEDDVQDKGSDKSEANEESIEEEKSARDGSSSNSYTDDFEDDKEENSSIQEPTDLADKSTSNSSPKMEEDKKVSQSDENDVLMVKIDLTMDASKNEAKIVIMKDDSNVIGDVEIQEDRTNQEDKLKSPIQQRVSQILANTVGSQISPRDKNTRYQDYYITTYEDITPVNSPESASPVKSNQLVSLNTFNNEAEELLKKQLAIELEIKHLEQQQKEQLPFVYMREIPNKPPPPYTPPSTPSNALTILPSRVDDLKEICRYSAKVLYNAYLSNNLHAVTFSEGHFKTINTTKCTKECCLFVFDLCREIAESHYKRFQTKKVASWLKLPEESRLILGKPFTYHQLENHIHSKVKELLGFEKKNVKENAITRWSKKKKDHVDEILVLESQAEEQEWLNYDNDELMVKNEVTDAILDILLSETVKIYKNIFS